MTFSEKLWEQNLPLYQEILAHPFNRELASGELNPETFQFYMEQDALYLVYFSKALALIAGRSYSSERIGQFLHFSLGALMAERELHAHFLSPDCMHNDIDPSPTCLAYTQYLLATAAIASTEEAICAVLPCFWIYREVGLAILQNREEDNPYALWINTYSSEAFSEGTDRIIGVVDAIAQGASPLLRTRMEKAFETSSLFEWHFWNDAYNRSLFRALPSYFVR